MLEDRFFRLYFTRKILLVVMFLGSYCALAQNMITSGSQYTPEELVKEVLINSPCAQVSNVTFKRASQYNCGFESLGYFENLDPAFPMENGVILSSGKLAEVPGPKKPGNQSSGCEAWTGDDELLNYMKGLGADVREYLNATVLEFDFIPTTDHISFSFIFASDEYGTYQCTYPDAFAFFLTNLETGVKTNLALVPGTTDPISVTTIRDEFKAGNAGCRSANPEYFANYYPGGTTTAPINFLGHTVKMIAESNVIVNTKYHIKLVIADRNDTSMDSAVFIEGGSFDIGQPALGDDLVIEGATALCPGDTHLLDSKIDPSFYLLQWTKDGIDIVGANDTTYLVTETGLYGLKVGSKGIDDGGCLQDPAPVMVEFFDSIILERELEDLIQCTGVGQGAIFNLQEGVAGLSFNQVSYSFYESEDDAENEENAVGDANSMYTLPSQFNVRTIWVRIQSDLSRCYKVVSFDLRKEICEVELVPLNDLVKCDLGDVTFDLTVYTDVVYHGIPGYDVTYHISEEDAISGSNAIEDALLEVYPGVHNQEIWVRVTKSDDDSVFKFTSFKLRLRSLPAINPKITPLYACTDVGSTIGIFNLSSKDNEVKQSASGLIVEYYLTKELAEGGNPADMLQTEGYSSGAKTIWVRLYSPITGCFSIGNLELLLSASPVLNSVEDFTACDISGYHSFNLNTIALGVITDPLADVNYSFHKTYYNAEQKLNGFVGGNYTNVVPWSEVIYIRVENKQTKCFTIKAIGLRVGTKPLISSPSDYVVCDLNGTGVSNFDLTEKEVELLNGLDSSLYNIYYYTTMPLAEDGDPLESIHNPYQYSNLTSNYVYIRVEDKVTGCFSIVSLKLVVSPLPVIPGLLTAYTVCDGSDNDGIAEFVLSLKKQELLDGNVNLLVSFHESEVDAISGSDGLDQTSYYNTTAYNQTIYVRVVDRDTGCFIVRPLELVVNNYPAFGLGDKGVVSLCTDSTNGIGVFNLVEIGLANIVNIQQYTVGYYETFDYAVQNVNRILDAEKYSNVGVNESSVWIRIQHNVTGCIGVYEIVLKTYRTPSLPATVPDLVLCDNLGNSFDGRAVIDLSLNSGVITSKFTGVNFELTYYRNKADAETGLHRIVEPEQYHNVDSEEVIWFRLEDTDTGCYSIGEFGIKVQVGLRLIRPDDFVVCSDLSLGQNKYSFDLTVQEDFMIGGLPIFGTSFYYYESESDALLGVNAIDNVKSYINKSPVQNIWVVMENEYGCKSNTTITLRVFATPEPNLSPLPLEVCENEFGLGIGTFDLRNSIGDIVSGDLNLNLKYYETESDAYNDVAEIAVADLIAYNSSTTIIYVRVENPLTGINPNCFVVVKLPLQVNAMPYLEEVTPLVICLETPPDFYEFNLQDKDLDILAGRLPENYTIRYYFEEDDALLGEHPLPYDYTNVTERAQVIWFRIEDKKTGCFNIGELLLQIEDRVLAFQIDNPEAYCDDNDGFNAANDGFTQIDLTVFDQDIIGDQDNAADLVVVYYASETDYQNNMPIQAPGSFVNTSNPQTIIAVVRNADEGLYCEALISFEVMVHALPEVLPITGGYLCTDLRTGEITPFLIDSKLDAALYDFIWLFNGEEIEGATLPYYEAMKAGTYTITTVDKATGCPSFNSADAVVTAIDPFTIIIEEDLGGRDQISDTGSQTIVVRVEEKEGKFPAGTYEYALNDGEYQDGNVFHNVEAGDHLVWVRDKVTGACAVSKVVSIMNYPKYFTPNGDGFNDTWNVLGLKSQPNAKVYIFDRTGKLLKQLSPLGDGWDGTYGGRPMPSTDYWFTVEYVDFNGYGREFKGHFSLKR